MVIVVLLKLIDNKIRDLFKVKLNIIRSETKRKRERDREKKERKRERKKYIQGVQ